MGGSEFSSSGIISESGIPIRNLWFLLAYASDLLPDLMNDQKSIDDFSENLLDLVARLLLEETEIRVRRSLSVDYEERSGELSRLRGRVSHIQNLRRNSMSRGKIYCEYSNLTSDTIPNRLVRTALTFLARTVLDFEIALKCRQMDTLLSARGVGFISNHRDISLGRDVPKNPRDSRMCALALLALRMDIPGLDEGRTSLYFPVFDDHWLRQLFEKSILGFYRFHLPKTDWSVFGGKQMKWDTQNYTEQIEKILPLMRTDIEILNRKSGHRTIIDTKFAEILKTGQFGNIGLKSGYVYQLYSYVRSQEAIGADETFRTSGMLIHPSVGYALLENTTIQGHRFSFATVDLMGSPKEISERLLHIFRSEIPATTSVDV